MSERLRERAGSNAARDAVVAILFAATAPACGQVLGVNEYRTSGHGGAGGSGGTGGQVTESGAPDVASDGPIQIGAFRYKEPRCGDCVQSNCSLEADLCARSPACFTFAQCIALCGPEDHACRGKCAVNIRGSRTDKTTALQACEALHCEGLCGSLVAFPESCDACIAEQCRDSLQTASTGGDPNPLVACQLETCSSACGEQDLSCLGSVVWPDADRQTAIDFSALVLTQTGERVAGLDVQACGNAAPDCKAPAQPAKIATSDGQGVAGPFHVDGLEIFGETPSRFFSYFLIVDPANQYLREMSYIFPPVSAGGTMARIVFPRAQVAAAYGGLVTQDPALGGVSMDVASCWGPKRIAGAVVTIDDPGALRIYGNPPLTNLTATDGSGVVVFLNVKPGPHQVDADIPKTGQHLGTVKVWVSANTTTAFDFVPTP